MIISQDTDGRMPVDHDPVMHVQQILERLQAGEDAAAIRFVAEAIWLRVAKAAGTLNELNILASVAEKVRSMEGTGKEHFTILSDLASLLYENGLTEEAQQILNELTSIANYTISHRQPKEEIPAASASAPKRRGRPPKRKPSVDRESSKRAKVSVDIPPIKDEPCANTKEIAPTRSATAPKRRGRPPKQKLAEAVPDIPDQGSSKERSLSVLVPTRRRLATRHLPAPSPDDFASSGPHLVEPVAPKRARGRPRKTVPAILPPPPPSAHPEASTAQLKGPSRRTRASTAAVAKVTASSATTHPPGQPTSIIAPADTAPPPGPDRFQCPTGEPLPPSSRGSAASFRSSISVTTGPFSSASSASEYDGPLPPGRMAPLRKVRMRRFVDEDGHVQQEMVLEGKRYDQREGE